MRVLTREPETPRAFNSAMVTHDTIFRFACGRFHRRHHEAAQSVYQAAIRTPLVRLDLPFAAADGAGPEIYLKLEALQPIGSFKIRGAWNAVRALPPEALAAGVWTVSAAMPRKAWRSPRSAPARRVR